MATEIAQMHLIYRSSYITISAARANHCQQGFLHDWSLPSSLATAYKLPFATPSGLLGSVLLCPFKPRAPIDTRCWTLQEHLLARRILRFTDFRQHWSCRAGLWSEHKDDKNIPYFDRSEALNIHDNFREISKRGISRDCIDWMSLVSEYSERHMTNRSDKLTAISAIAESWNERPDEVYLAGIWKSHLPTALMWTGDSSASSTHLTTYCAPSWSWASTVGKVIWQDAEFTEVDSELEIRDCSITLAHSHAPYGAVKDAYLVVDGLLQPAILTGILNRPSYGRKDTDYLDLNLADCYLDFHGEDLADMTRDAKLFCLQICKFDEMTSMGPSGLILATSNCEEFWRIGRFGFILIDQDEIDGGYITEEDAREAASDREIVMRSAFQNSIAQTITTI